MSYYYKVQTIFNRNASLYSLKSKSFLYFDSEEIEEVRLRRPLSVDWKQDNKLKLYFHRKWQYTNIVNKNLKHP